MRKKPIFSIIRTLIINSLATTCLSCLFMCFSAILQSYTLWGVTVPFEILLVNVLMNFGFYLIQKIEFKYFFINYIIMFVYLLGLLIGFGVLFNWFHANAVWLICLAGLFVFVVSLAIDIVKVNKEALIINKKLEQRRKKDEGLEQE